MRVMQFSSFPSLPPLFAVAPGGANAAGFIFSVDGGETRGGGFAYKLGFSSASSRQKVSPLTRDRKGTRTEMCSNIFLLREKIAMRCFSIFSARPGVEKCKYNENKRKARYAQFRTSVLE